MKLRFNTHKTHFGLKIQFPRLDAALTPNKLRKKTQVPLLLLSYAYIIEGTSESSQLCVSF